MIFPFFCFSIVWDFVHSADKARAVFSLHSFQSVEDRSLRMQSSISACYQIIVFCANKTVQHKVCSLRKDFKPTVGVDFVAHQRPVTVQNQETMSYLDDFLIHKHSNSLELKECLYLHFTSYVRSRLGFLCRKEDCRINYEWNGRLPVATNSCNLYDSLLYLELFTLTERSTVGISAQEYTISNWISNNLLQPNK